MHCFDATNVLINSYLFRKYFYSNFILKSSARLVRPILKNPDAPFKH